MTGARAALTVEGRGGGAMKRPVRASLVALALAVTGCEEIVDAMIHACDCADYPAQECQENDGRCAGTVLEVCRQDWCTCETYWEFKVDCAGSGLSCDMPEPGWAICVKPPAPLPRP